MCLLDSFSGDWLSDDGFCVMGCEHLAGLVCMRDQFLCSSIKGNQLNLTINSTLQGSGRERNLLFPLPVQPSTPSHLAEKFHGCQPAGTTLNTHLPQHQKRKKVSNDDDFAVPVYVPSDIDQCPSKTQNEIPKEKVSALSQTYPGHSTNLQNGCDKDAKRSSAFGPKSRNETRHLGEENPKICILIRDHAVKPLADLSTRDKVDGPAKEASALPIQKYVDFLGSNLGRLNDSFTSLQHEPRVGLQENDHGHCDGDESGRDVEKEIVPQTRSGACTREEHSSPDEPAVDNDHHGTNTCGSLQLRNGEKSDDLSGASMLDCISGSDISPDDVVGMIGQKHFWKARKAIVK